MPATSAIDIVSDADVALKWFHAAGEEEVEAARALLAGQRERTVALRVLDLTAHELGNALLRGRERASAEQVTTVLDALREICPSIAPTRRSSARPRAWLSSTTSPSTTRPTPRSPAAAAQRLPLSIRNCYAPGWDVVQASSPRTSRDRDRTRGFASLANEPLGRTACRRLPVITPEERSKR